MAHFHAFKQSDTVAAPTSIKDDRLHAIDEHPTLRVGLNRAHNRSGLQVPPYGDERIHLVGMIHWLDDLADNRALIQIVGHIVRRRANHLNAARVRLMVRARARKARQERAVDIDATPVQPLAGVSAERVSR